MHMNAFASVLVLRVQRIASGDFDTAHNALLQAKPSIKTHVRVH